MKVRIIVSGYGNVGKAFVKIVNDKKEILKRDYNLDLIITGIIGKEACLFEEYGLCIGRLLKFDKGTSALSAYGKDFPDALIGKDEFFKDNEFKGDTLVEASPTDISTGEPGLSIILKALDKKMNVVAASKGALVTSYDKIVNKARDLCLEVRYSGATAAALPTLDIGRYCLSGSEIISIIGILNGTTNYVLSKMYMDGMSFDEALEEARNKGIAEKNSDYDIKGIDSACKILLLANSLLGASLKLTQAAISGIQNIDSEAINSAKKKGNTIKLLAKAYRENGMVKVSVSPEEIPLTHVLSSVNGTNKAVVFKTDTMGEVAALGGGSDPVGAAAAVLKDIINIYKK